MKFLKRFFRHRHKWETTCVNKFQLPTMQKCKCGITRQVNTKLAGRPLMYCWQYSDGTISEPFALGEGF